MCLPCNRIWILISIAAGRQGRRNFSNFNRATWSIIHNNNAHGQTFSIKACRHVEWRTFLNIRVIYSAFAQNHSWNKGLCGWSIVVVMCLSKRTTLKWEIFHPTTVARSHRISVDLDRLERRERAGLGPIQAK